MARSHLTLAALATSAIAGLDVAGARSYRSGGQGEYDSALLKERDGRQLIIRVPSSQAAESEQGADLVALRALSQGIRGRLPFDVPTYVGQTPIGGTRAVVYEFLPGDHISVDDIHAENGLAASIGRAVAAVHTLPTAFVGEAGLPVLSATECHDSTSSLIETAVSTGLVPTGLRDRWREAARENASWQFQPTVINGAFSAESLLIEGGTVRGVLGWAALRVGDPARDLHWILAMNGAAAEAALEAYSDARHVSTDRQFTQRAMLYAELEVARWLLHGREVHDQSVVDDAIQMMDGLVETVHSDEAAPLAAETGPIMAISDVEAMLQETPGGLSTSREASGGMRPVEDEPRERRLPDDED
ncbi:phosphotransferase [Leifsonia sp. Root112D2]|jgi:macrolide phosphotransferase|uniref:phosphotransferase n=1 Tax=Leifsonia sp. Root112D2 TaxID=1736426 RepID=UPI0006F67939|nr:phosphotransferase [Leifsonia sp. Root112D2]KQV07578.1 macrolide 2'-phosphotransferase [Leifsonia sp. Root112D2]